MLSMGIDAKPLEQPPEAEGSELARKPESGGTARINIKEGCQCSEEAIMRRAFSTRKGGLGTPKSHLDSEQKAKWLAAAQIATQELRRARNCVGHSTFSALHLDGMPVAKCESSKPASACKTIMERASVKFEDRRRHSECNLATMSQELGKGRPAPMPKQWQAVGSDFEAETSSEISTNDALESLVGDTNLSLSTAGRCVSFGLSSAASVIDDSPVSIEEDDELEAPPADEEHLVAEAAKEQELSEKQEACDATELGDFFQTPKGARARSRKAKLALPTATALVEPTAGGSAAPLAPNVPSTSLDSTDDLTAPSLTEMAPADVRALLLCFQPLAGSAPVELKGLRAQPVPRAEEPLVVPPALHFKSRQVSAPAPLPAGLPARQVSAPAMDSPNFAMARQCSAPTPVPVIERREAATSSRAMRLTPSAKAYRVSLGGKSRVEELRRAVKCLLNKVCPESVTTIAAKIAEVQVCSAEELQEVISIIFQKALSEPHYCATYADLAFGIKSTFPEFTSSDGGKPQTFKTLLLDVCQREFESLPTTLEPTSEQVQQYDAEELEYRRKQTKDRLLAYMKLIGHLFLRQMLSPRIMGAVIEELTLCHADHVDRLPEGHCVECAVELLLSIGHTLEALPVGKACIAHVCGRLMDLQRLRGLDGRGAYCKRIQFAIQDLLDIRAAGWARKVFSGVARTKEEIRMEQQRDLLAQARGKDVQTGQIIISGQRPEYIEAAKRDAPAMGGV